MPIPPPPSLRRPPHSRSSRLPVRLIEPSPYSDVMDACTALAESIDRLAERGYSSRRFLTELGHAAGVRRGPLWLTDAASCGRNRLRGRGFHRTLDDHTDGQARHFAGTVAVAARLGGGITRWLT